MFRRIFIGGAIILALLLGPPLSSDRVNAAPILDFGIVAPTAGTISYGGGASPLIGVRIEVDNVVGLGTPLQDGVAVDLPGALLNFNTGNLAGSDALHWNFGAGGSISIVWGDFTLLSGTFSDAIVTHTDDEFKVAVAGFLDTKDPSLTAFYGLPDAGYIGNFNISFLAEGDVPNAFTSKTVLSGDVINTPVPEPAAMLLLGVGLLGVAGLKRKNP